MVKERLQKQLELKESNATQGKVEVSIDTETQHKFNNSLVILEEILSRQRYPNDKLGIGFVEVGKYICNKDLNHQYTFCRNLEPPPRNEITRYVKNFRRSKTVQCWRCKFVGHVARYCHSIKCYVCDKYGHKSSQCYFKMWQQKSSS